MQKLAEIETYLGHVEDQESQIADLQQMGVLKDLKIADLEKELRATKDEAAQMLVNMDGEKQEITQDAKVSAAIAMFKIQLQMAAEVRILPLIKAHGTWRVGRQDWQSWRMRTKQRRSQCWRAVMLTRIRVEKLVVMEQQRCELLDWAMMDISRLGRSPIF